MSPEEQKALMQALRTENDAALVDEMGQLHNQFVSFISAAQLPLTHVSVVLAMLQRETLDQAFKRYLGE